MNAIELAGAYFITASWNGWSPEAMKRSDADPNLHTLEVGPLRQQGGEFKILRNKDKCQAFYPPTQRASALRADEVRGPDGQSFGLNWCLNNRSGDYFRIEFRRTPNFGSDQTSISCTKIERQTLTN